jgi:hypothetical protein
MERHKKSFPLCPLRPLWLEPSSYNANVYRQLYGTPREVVSSVSFVSSVVSAFSLRRERLPALYGMFPLCPLCPLWLAPSFYNF